jgi:hypothetical protein
MDGRNKLASIMPEALSDGTIHLLIPSSAGNNYLPETVCAAELILITKPSIKTPKQMACLCHLQLFHYKLSPQCAPPPPPLARCVREHTRQAETSRGPERHWAKTWDGFVVVSSSSSI